MTIYDGERQGGGESSDPPKYNDSTLTPDALFLFDGDILDTSGNGVVLSAPGTTPRFVISTVAKRRWVMFDSGVYLVSTDPVFATNTEFSFSALMMLTNNSSQHPNIIGHVAASGASPDIDHWIIGFRPNSGLENKIAAWHEGISPWEVATHLAPIGVPFVLGVTRAADGKTYKMYIDGELIATLVAASAAAGTGGQLQIGRWQDGANTYGDKHYMGSCWWKAAELSAASMLSLAAQIKP